VYYVAKGALLCLNSLLLAPTFARWNANSAQCCLTCVPISAVYRLTAVVGVH